MTLVNQLPAVRSRSLALHPILHENCDRVTRPRHCVGYRQQRVVPFYSACPRSAARGRYAGATTTGSGSQPAALNAEYRWTVFDGLDGALFYDAGKVEPRLATSASRT